MVVCGLSCPLTRITYPSIQAKVVKVRVLVDHEALSGCRSGDDMSRCVCVCVFPRFFPMPVRLFRVFHHRQTRDHHFTGPEALSPRYPLALSLTLEPSLTRIVVFAVTRIVTAIFLKDKPKPYAS